MSFRTSADGRISRWSSLVRPLGLRIPLIMVGMLAASLAIMGWLGHTRVNQFAEEAELSRLRVTTDQLATTFGVMLDRMRSDLSRVAATPAVGDAAGSFPSSSARDAAKQVLAAYRGSSAQFLAVAIWSADGRELLAHDGSDALAAARRPLRREVDPVDSAVVISPLSFRGDTAIYSATAPIMSHGRVSGYVVATRRLVVSSEGAALYGSLIGPRARIMFANAGETTTIDLARGGGVDIPAGASVGEYTPADGIDRFYTLSGIPGTPWRLVVDEPRYLVLAPTRRFTLGMLGVAAIFIVIAGTVGWFVIRRALRPLADVTHAVVGFAQGHHAERVEVAGDEEIAQLGRAFNAMADRVASRTDALMESIQEHEESERRYRALIDRLPDGIMVHRNRTISFVNPACARLFGETDPAVLVGRSVLDFVDPAEHDLTLKRLQQVDEGDHVPTRELRLRRVDGANVLVESTNLPLFVDGAAAIQTILHDVTERHLLEDRLRQAQKMEAVGRLAGGIAHDFNNILTVIDAHAEFALARPGGSDSMDIDEIRKASASAARLTRQLLAFSRKQTATPAAIDLASSVRDVMVMLTRTLGDDIEVNARLAPELWPVFVDGNHIEQVLLNLALNARDAMPLGGRLTFTTANTEVGPEYRSASGEMIPAGDYVMLTVEDTGTGMTPDVASRAFEPFYTTKGTGQGTGLGLSMVYGIVKQAGGHIWLYTEPGEGTSFKIMLPRYAGAEAPRPVAAPSSLALPVQSVHALLVEDQPNVRAAIERSLRNAGVTVTAVRDAASALDALSRLGEVDVLITDMMMPGMSGAELATVVASSHPALPVIIMSGYSEELTNQQRQLPPNSRFVEKPVNAKRLMEMIAGLRPRANV
jgi:PAS domain S-box-containing protein